MHKYILFLLLLIYSSCGLKNHQTNYKETIKIGFYNVENLFDVYDDPNTNDNEFLPQGKKQWTTVRYKQKLEQLAKVIEGLDKPILMGLCEVENKAVTEDLAKHKLLQNAHYKVIQEESNDWRGIDVALLYNSTQFSVINHETIKIKFPAHITHHTTRDILKVTGLLNKKDTLHVFVNHWSSRSGGERKSEPKRLYIAQQLRQAVDKVFAQNKQANILIMGDFNDETTNKSVATILAAQPLTKTTKTAQLYNCMSDLDNQNKGTYNYKGKWNMLDQIIVSSTLANTQNWTVTDVELFKQNWLLFKHKKYGYTPSRTYGGNRYHGGFSDHLAVSVTLGR